MLAAPDRKRLEKQEFEGRRIKRVEDGWLVLNGEKYRRMVSEEMRKSRLRRAQATYREKHKQTMKSTPQKGEVAAVKALADGDLEMFEKIASGELKEAV